MTAEQFAYWMQGFAELTGGEPPTAAQWKSMREHLQTVFVKVTPPVGPKWPASPLYDPNKSGVSPLEWIQRQPRCSGSLVGAGDGDTRVVC